MKDNKKTLIFDPEPKATVNHGMDHFLYQQSLDNLKQVLQQQGETIIFDSSANIFDTMTEEERADFEKRCENRLNRNKTHE